MRPELSLPELSGPSSPVPMSTPSTPKLLVLKLARKFCAPEPPEPEPEPRRRDRPPAPPPLTLMAGTVPLSVRLFRVRPPAAAATSSSLATVETEDELIEASVALDDSVLVLILVPAAGRFWSRCGSRSRTIPG